MRWSMTRTPPGTLETQESLSTGFDLFRKRKRSCRTSRRRRDAIVFGRGLPMTIARNMSRLQRSKEFRAADFLARREKARKRAEKNKQHTATHSAPSQPRVDGFGLQREHAEDAFMYAPHRLAAGEPVQRLQAEAVLAQREGSFEAETTLAQP